MREQAVFALGQLRYPASVEGLIVTAIHDAKPDVRQQAVFALGQIRDRRARRGAHLRVERYRSRTSANRRRLHSDRFAIRARSKRW